ncbi:MAG TPA: hypothetical protein VFR18_23175 [Terriglobia bacterium]|nr:hypothetical protein [Terriglobia bacterium]
MKTHAKAVAVLGIATLLSIPALAQWAPFPTRGVPKTASGEPDLTGPVPRTADGKPDLSGIWANRGGGGGGGQRGGNAANAQQGGNAANPQRGGNAATPQRGGNAAAAAPADGIPVATFGNVGAGFRGEGLPIQPWAAELVKKRMADNSKDNPDAHCLPMGFMQFHTHPQPRKIIQTPDVILIIYEANSGLRQIFMDGRPLPGPDAEPWWYGYSVGKWEGDTLVVETRNIRDGEWLDVRGTPLTTAGKVTERFRRVNYGNLEIDITIDDPKAYTKPWTVRVNQRVMLDTELIEFICEERDATHYVGADGKK